MVEDDPSVADVLAGVLEARGWVVRVAVDGVAALDAEAAAPSDLVLLDLGLPDIDGIEVCRRIRAWTRNPVIVLSADGAEDRKIAALDAGADDYVTKPFSMPELLARVRVARRHRALLALVADDDVITVGQLVIDTGARAAKLGDEDLWLTRKEFDLLELLARNAGRVLNHGVLLQRVWGSASGGTESLRVHVAQLRRKIGSGSGRPAIETEPGTGYRLALPDDTSTELAATEDGYQ